MQIGSNTTSMPADLCVATDKEGRTSCVVVIKGTFAVNPDGTTRLAEEQEALVYADVHYGDPATTSVQYECDFAPVKPAIDVIVHGHAHSSTGQPVKELYVGLQVKSLRKQIRVIGDRQWGRDCSERSSFSPEVLHPNAVGVRASIRGLR